MYDSKGAGGGQKIQGAEREEQRLWAVEGRGSCGELELWGWGSGEKGRKAAGGRSLNTGQGLTDPYPPAAFPAVTLGVGMDLRQPSN